MAVDNVGHAWVLNCHPGAYFFDLATDDENEWVAKFLYAFFNRNSSHKNAFLSKPYVLLLKVMIQLYRAAAAVHENIPGTEAVIIW